MNFTKNDGLVGNVNTIYCSKDGVVWLGTNSGLSRCFYPSDKLRTALEQNEAASDEGKLKSSGWESRGLPNGLLELGEIWIDKIIKL